MIVRQITIMGTRAKVLCVMILVLCTCSLGQADTIVRFETAMGNFHVQLADTVAPLTVANFLNYVNDGDFVNSFFHRLVPGFVLQGGGFTFQDNQFNFVPTDPAVLNEYNISNTYGTIAMAKTSEGPDTATSQFFFNLGDNSENLDAQNGGFTVFGQVMGSGMDVVNLLASKTVWDASSFYGAFSDLPLIDYDPNGTVPWPDTLEMVYAITVVIEGDANKDGVVSAADYAAVQANFGHTGDVGIPGDANFDGVVSAADYASVQANFGNTVPAGASAAPEPATLCLLTIGSVAMLRHKRK